MNLKNFPPKKRSVFRYDICSVIEDLGHQHDPAEWCLFFGFSKVSLQSALLHNGNTHLYPSPCSRHGRVLWKYAANFWKDPVWKIQLSHVSGIKSLSLLVGLQLGYKMFCCFLRAWDSRYRKYDYIQKQWPKRESVIPGQENVANTILINREKRVYFSLLLIKLGLIKISSRRGSK